MHKSEPCVQLLTPQGGDSLQPPQVHPFHGVVHSGFRVPMERQMLLQSGAGVNDGDGDDDDDDDCV